MATKKEGKATPEIDNASVILSMIVSLFNAEIIPKMIPIPRDSTPEQRLQMLVDYKAELTRLNPGYFNEDGSMKTLWQRFKYWVRL